MKASKRSSAPVKGRRAQNREAIRKRIVKAALALFQEKGFDSTTTKAIARRARIAEGTVFNYFETKEDIALHFFELEVDHAIAVVRKNARLRHAPLEEKLFVLIETQLDFLKPHQRFIGAAFIQALRPTSKLGFSGQAIALRNRYVSFVQELIEESLPRQTSGIFAWFAPLVFWIYYLGILLYWLNDDSEGKQNTLALLDRSLKFGVMLLKKGEI
ncbi:MAG TPA: TetR/AcrR family transcriptional regulator [Candidatus Angelobacter sp.]|jgi:AcrR family transcriptional regulator|nr:TetR/AcrR family transcriptional regulator [Candidatus Angelobacter sp.]